MSSGNVINNNFNIINNFMGSLPPEAANGTNNQPNTTTNANNRANSASMPTNRAN